MLLPAQIESQVEQRLDARRVDVVDRLCVEHEPRGLGRRGANRLSYAALHVLRVREEEAVVEPVDDDARRDPGRRMDRDVTVALDVRHPAEHGVVGTRAPADGVDDREPDRDDERLENAEEDDAAHRHARDRDLDAVDPRQRPPGAGVDDVDPGGDDHRAEHRLRQVLHGLGQEEENHDDRSRGEEAGDLRPRAHRVVHRGACTARTHGERLREAGGGVRRTHRQELLGRTHGLATLPGERARRQDLVGERDEEQPERRRHELDDVAERRCRHPRSRQPARDRADRRDAVGCEVEGPRDPDRPDDDDERTGDDRRNRRRPNIAASDAMLTASVIPLTSPSSRITSQSRPSDSLASMSSPSSLPSCAITSVTATPCR